MNPNAWIALAALAFTIVCTVGGFYAGKIKAAYDKGQKETAISSRLDAIESKLDNELKLINQKLDNALESTVSFKEYAEHITVFKEFKAQIEQRVVALEKNVFKEKSTSNDRE